MNLHARLSCGKRLSPEHIGFFLHALADKWRDNMNKTRFSAVSVVALMAFCGNPITSTGATLTATSIDSGGARLTNDSVVLDACIGVIGSLSTNGTGTHASKGGYAGQIFDLVSIEVSASPTSVNETATCQFAAVGVYDDDTRGEMIDTPTWSVLSGPLASIDSNGMATADVVFEDTAATAQAERENIDGTSQVLVVNVDADDYGSYASDGLPDNWQVQYFGTNNPNAASNADPDGDGDDNIHEYVAGTTPTNTISYFTLRIERVEGVSTQMNIVFSPAYVSRNYSVEQVQSLSDVGGWNTLTNFTEATNGVERTVTDLANTNPVGFYRIRIVYVL